MTTTQTRVTHPCPVEGCDRPRVNAQNLCSLHWAGVPAQLSLSMLAAWDQIETAWPRYIEARDAALATVPGAEVIADQVDREALQQLAATVNA